LRLFGMRPMIADKMQQSLRETAQLESLLKPRTRAIWSRLATSGAKQARASGMRI
jgi:hypothetical protein